MVSSLNRATPFLVCDVRWQFASISAIRGYMKASSAGSRSLTRAPGETGEQHTDCVQIAARRTAFVVAVDHQGEDQALDRKSTRLNSSHLGISYAVFCL